MRFRKKPVVIEAFRFERNAEIPEWFKEAVAAKSATVIVSQDYTHGAIVIDTLEGRMTAHPGDWIIRGVMGELYPCKSDIFSATYEPAP